MQIWDDAGTDSEMLTRKQIARDDFTQLNAALRYYGSP